LKASAHLAEAPAPFFLSLILFVLALGCNARALPPRLPNSLMAVGAVHNAGDAPSSLLYSCYIMSKNFHRHPCGC
jgi:hypothetical protein